MVPFLWNKNWRTERKEREPENIFLHGGFVLLHDFSMVWAFIILREHAPPPTVLKNVFAVLNHGSREPWAPSRDRRKSYGGQDRNMSVSVCKSSCYVSSEWIKLDLLLHNNFAFWTTNAESTGKGEEPKGPCYPKEVISIHCFTESILGV